MDNAAIVARLQELGPLPAADASEMEEFPLQEFDDLVQQLAAPLLPAHATALINLGPPPDTGSFGLEWALIHAVDLLSVQELTAAVALARDTEVKRAVEIRLANYAASQRH
jgi:hypothetical protein